MTVIICRSCWHFRDYKKVCLCVKDEFELHFNHVIHGMIKICQNLKIKRNIFPPKNKISTPES